VSLDKILPALVFSVELVVVTRLVLVDVGLTHDGRNMRYYSV
jgi:hypothetical protein